MVTFFGMMADVSLVRYAIVVICKETGGWLLREPVQKVRQDQSIT